MLRAVARRMSESKSHVPHFYLQCEVDMGRALELRDELNAGSPARASSSRSTT